MNLSIALVTRNRPLSLERWMQSITTQTKVPFEIVVSDDSDMQYTEQVKQICEKYNVLYVTGPKKGLYANRNNAFVYCSGTHILSADDDHTHPVDFIESIYKAIQQSPERIWILAERVPSSPHAPLTCPAEINWNGLAGKTPSNPDDCMAISCGATVYPRKVFNVGMRYPEYYPFGHIWYLWGVMLHQKEFRISFLHTTFVWHHWMETNDISRAFDSSFVRKYLESNLFVALSFNSIFKKSFALQIILLFKIGKLFLIKETIDSYEVKTKLRFADIKHLFKNVSTFKNEWRLANT